MMTNKQRDPRQPKKEQTWKVKKSKRKRLGTLERRQTLTG